MEQTQELIRNAAVSVAITPTVISEAQYLPTQRNVILIQNTSTAGQKVSIGVGDDAVLGEGIVLSPGGYYQDSADGQGYKPSNERITAIADVAGTVSVHERIVMRGF